MRWGDLAALEYGKALRGYRSPLVSAVRVFGTNGPIGWTKQALGKGPTVIVGRKGAYRGVHYSPGPFWVIDTAYWLRPVVDEIDMRWAYYQLLTQDINARDSGSAIPSLSRSDFYGLSVLVPPVSEQRAIAEMLGALDDKIEANRTKVSLSYEVLRSTWQLTAKETAKTVAVGDIADLDKGLSYKGAGLGSGAPLVNLGNFGVDGLFHADALKRYSGESRGRHWVQDGDLVLANTDLTQRREILGQPALVDTGEERALFSHHVYAVRGRTKERDQGVSLWLYAALREDSFRDRAVTYAIGTTVAALPRDAVLTYELAWPAASKRHSWASMAQDLVAEANHTSRESRALAAIRDALLPPLLAGELRVRDPEALVEGLV